MESKGSVAPSSSNNPKQGPKSFVRRDHLRSNEKYAQSKWERLRAFEANADPSREKFYVTFPYPYMNGRLHLGHAFSVTKAEFAARFQRMMGKNVLFPFGFHCTGMPIQAAANKLKEEIESFGFPPLFDDELEEVANLAVQSVKQPDEQDVIASKSKGKKSKLINKGLTGAKVRQYDIMRKMVDEAQVPLFVDPLYWLEYFPPLGVADLKSFGLSVDWRRSFITTSVNPCYDAFVQWQFNQLNEKKKIQSGFRPNVYSPKDKQVCADHDRSSGEGVVPQEYTIIKLEVVFPENEKYSFANNFQGRKVFLAAATLRPETMYGQTNCFVLPEGDYGAFLFKNDEILIMSERSAIGLAHQGYSLEWGKVIHLRSFKGFELLGLPLIAPLSKYDFIYTLPLITISMGKGTGIVTSVPSDAPDDYIALKELKEKPLWREKFGIESSMVEQFHVVPIIDIPGFGTSAAVALCEEMHVKSTKDTDKLKAIKDQVYLKGYYEGVILVGECAGMKVCDAKPIIRSKLLSQGLAIAYFEPESTVISRSGEECIVALTDQWYLAYGDAAWKETILRHVNSPDFNSFSSNTKDAFNGAIEWLKEWACSREFGLGTKLPWDKKWVIDSLSDSTIYMAYYTIANFIHGQVENMKGLSLPCQLDPQVFTDDVFSYIFLDKPLPEKFRHHEDILSKMRCEFRYWYPMDLRVSAKDLIANHLTMCLYNHAAVWDESPSMWPRMMFCNGHIMVDAEKMSKSKGNFLMMQECIEEYSSDATRFALADAGDGLEDANFDRSVANQAVSYLFVEEEWILSTLEEINAGKLRDDEQYLMDQSFRNEVDYLIEQTKFHFNNMNFREGLHRCWYDMIIARDFYRDWCLRTSVSMNKGCVQHFITSLVLMMQPICPHWSECLYEKVFSKEGTVCAALWPITGKYDAALRGKYIFFKSFVKNMKQSAAKKQIKGASVFIARTYDSNKIAVLQYMQEYYQNCGGKFESSFVKDLKQFIETRGELNSDTKRLMQFGSFMRSEVDERGFEALNITIPFDQKGIIEVCNIYFFVLLFVF